MTRPPRIIIPHVPYHVTQRGNHGRDVFFSPDDYEHYLDSLKEYSDRYRFDIQAYCLMSNHIHLIGIPREEDSIAKTMQIVQSKHSKEINYRYGLTGSAWQQHHPRIPLDNSHLFNGFRYVEQNPARADIVKRCELYRYSSAAFHCGLREDKIIKPDFRFAEMFDNWIVEVNQMLDKEALEYLRYRTLKGLPCGDRKFVRRISHLTDQDYAKMEKRAHRKPDDYKPVIKQIPPSQSAH
jgi:putative transposase